jgi:hypothetical protein
MKLIEYLPCCLFAQHSTSYKFISLKSHSLRSDMRNVNQNRSHSPTHENSFFVVCSHAQTWHVSWYIDTTLEREAVSTQRSARRKKSLFMFERCLTAHFLHICTLIRQSGLEANRSVTFAVSAYSFYHSIPTVTVRVLYFFNNVRTRNKLQFS